jgi:hypothetical protein
MSQRAQLAILAALIVAIAVSWAMELPGTSSALRDEDVAALLKGSEDYRRKVCAEGPSPVRCDFD